MAKFEIVPQFLLNNKTILFSILLQSDPVFGRQQESEARYLGYSRPGEIPQSGSNLLQGSKCSCRCVRSNPTGQRLTGHLSLLELLKLGYNNSVC